MTVEANSCSNGGLTACSIITTLTLKFSHNLNMISEPNLNSLSL